jgi:thymidylate synthase (FAD)
MMNVELLNKEEIKNLFLDWGAVASVCYNTKTNKPENIGKHCLKSGHTSGSRGTYFKFKVTDAPRSVADQVIRSEIGTFKNVQSFRYVNKDSFNYEIPKEILDNRHLLDAYCKHMDRTMELYSSIQRYVEDKTSNKERANEQARYLLPMSTYCSFVIGFDIEALIRFMHKRLCTRAEDITRQVAIKMKEEVLKVLPELKDNLVPECKYLLWCPENKGCGAYPSKEELKMKL